MLPKISAALSKFVTPIQTTSGGSSAREKEFIRAQPERRAKVLHYKGKEKDPAGDRKQQSEDRSPESKERGPESEDPSPEFNRALGSSFLSLFDSLRQSSGAVFKWIGVNGYRLGMKATRRGGRLRKGAMLDVKVD